MQNLHHFLSSASDFKGHAGNLFALTVPMFGPSVSEAWSNFCDPVIKMELKVFMGRYYNDNDNDNEITLF